MNSMCKKSCGYILGHIHLFQPSNWIFVQAAKAFPVDYVLMALLVLFFFGASISGIATVGIRFLWVRVFQIRKGRTPPQALLVTTVMLALIMLAINYAIVSMVAPQYATYGTQTFCSKEPVSGKKPNCAGQPDMVLTCSEALAFKHAKDVCTPSVMSTFINRIALTWPFFGAVIYWAQFVFILVFLITLGTAMFRTPKLNLAELDEDAEVDEEEGLLASTGRRFNATWSDITGRTRSKSYGTQGQTNGAGSSGG
jgi:LMBR1 domain-containing protein 1